MIKNIFFLALFLGGSEIGLAQTLDIPATELNSTPPALTSDTLARASVKSPAVPAGKPARKISYGLSAGTQFSRVLGTATYLEPSVLFPITKKFSGFASLSMLTTFGTTPNFAGSDYSSANYAPTRRQGYILHVGGNYLINDRLNLTGSIWRDLSRNPMAPVNLLMPGGTNGMSFRANYKVSDHLSISGGFRYSNGNAYQNGWYNPASPFSY